MGALAQRGHALTLAAQLRPAVGCRAAPVDTGCWLAPGPPCDRVGHQPHEPTTPKPTRNHPLMSFPGEQMPGHAARQFDQRWRPWRLVPHYEPSMRN